MSSDSKTSALKSGEILCPPAVSSKGFKIGEQIGSGAFAKVYKAEWNKMPDKQLACKRFDLRPETGVDELWREKCLKQEMKVVMRVNHPNIIRGYDVTKTRSSAFIFMQFAKNGSVDDYLANHGPIPEVKAKKWFKDILKGVQYLHNSSRPIAHRDIKPDNFLLDEKWTALLSDFGFSCIALESQSKLLKGTQCGTDGYKAPEILSLSKGHVYDAKPVDMYAMGVSLYVMLFNKNPFGDISKVSPNELIVKEKNKSYSYDKNIKISKNAINIIDLLLEPKPQKRLTSDNALKHSFCDN